MAKKKKKLVQLVCSDCKRVNYHGWREKSNKQSKFCKWCRGHKQHKEKKK